MSRRSALLLCAAACGNPDNLVIGGISAGLVFGGSNEGNFYALDALTGQPLWMFQTGGDMESNAMSFTVDGKQHIAVESGWGGDSRGMNAALNRLFPGEFPEVPEGGAVWAFTLE